MGALYLHIDVVDLLSQERLRRYTEDLAIHAICQLGRTGQGRLKPVVLQLRQENEFVFVLTVLQGMNVEKYSPVTRDKTIMGRAPLHQPGHQDHTEEGNG